MDCIFCKIVKGEIPSYKIYEDEDTLAFLDIADDIEGHTLVIPKKHCHNVIDCPKADLAHVMNTVQLVSRHYTEKCGYDSVNLMNVNEMIPHFHMHIFPRRKDDGKDIYKTYPKIGNDLKTLAEKIKVSVISTNSRSVISTEAEGVVEKSKSSQPLNCHPERSDSVVEGSCESICHPERSDSVVEGSGTGKKIILYTDGACSGNPGLGGWAGILRYGNQEKEISGGEKETTNNRMELMAVIVSLEKIKEPCEVDVYSDSAYVVNAFLQDWIGSWQKNNWRTSGNKEVQNIDLWKRLLVQTERHSVVWHKVKGHADNELNNRCDALARGEIEKLRTNQ